MGRINIEIDDDVHRKLKSLCALHGKTIIEFINETLEEKFKE